MSFLSSIFGGDKVKSEPIQFNMPGFSGGGLNGSFDGTNYSVTPDSSRNAAVSGLTNTYNSLGNQYGDLLKTVTPGYNDLLNTQITSLNNNATSAIGSLSQNLQSRRILGSSFGQDTISRAQNQIQNNRNSLIANNYLQSLQASTSLLGQQYDSYIKAYQNGLNEMNLEANTASQLSGQAASILSQNAQTQAKLDEDASKTNAANDLSQASGFGSFLGKIALAPVTGGGSLIGNFLGKSP